MRKKRVIMRTVALALTLATLCTVASFGQQATAPQTARQALIEMFFSKTQGTFMKHLPDATRTALEQSEMLGSLQQYSMLTSQLESQGKTVQTFETGSVLLATKNQAGEKVEITVENDSLQGDQDDIEVSFMTYKNGQPQRPPVMSHLTFSMITERGIWKLNEITVTLRIPLANPNLLKSITEGMKARSAAITAIQPQSQSQVSMQIQAPTQNVANDASVIAAMRNILAAEVTYAATYRSVGYTCTLSDLDGFGGGERNEHQAMLISSGLASGKKNGYVFTLSECGGSPATSFRLTATPNGNMYGRHAFCTDQNGAIRHSADGVAATCISAGTPWQ
jgi:hypothetical protein